MYLVPVFGYWWGGVDDADIRMNWTPNWQTVWEAKQETMKIPLEGDYDPRKRYIERLAALYGPATGEIIDSVIF